MRPSSIAFAGLLLLASCSSPEPTVTIRGTVAAADGSNLEDVWITVCDRVDGSLRGHCEGWREPVWQSRLTGAFFELAVPAGTILQVVASAPRFESEKVRLITGEPGSSQQVAFELGGLKYRETPERVALLYWPDGIPGAAVRAPMRQDDSGAWTVTVAPLERETMYRFNGVVISDRRSYVGGGVVDSERPHTASPWGFLLSVAPPSKDSVRFEYVHRFSDRSDGRVLLGAGSRDSEIWRDAEEQFRAWEQSFYDGGPDGASDWGEYASSYWSGVEAMRDSLLEATQGLTREVVAVNYLARTSDRRYATMRLIMDTVRPASPAWDWSSSMAPVGLIAGAEDVLSVDAYLGQVFTHMSNDSLAASMMHYAALTLAGEFQSAARAEGNWDAMADSLAMGMYLDLVQAYPNASAAKQAARTLDPNRPIQNGQPVPSFELASMDEPGRVLSSESLLGTTYLVDFWGTWCAPCIRDMPYMHAAYEKYKDRDFTIVSFAWDRREMVDTFRKEWPMPWEHVLLERFNNASNPVLRAFNVRGYPTAYLVSAEGIIIEADDVNLREAALDSTLATYLVQ